MNDAGRSVGPARGSYKLPLERVLVVHDEIDLPFGEVRTRLGGGLAGHNGLKSLKRELGSADFTRVRVGVGRPDSHRPGDRLGLRARALSRGRERGRASWSSAPARRSSASCSGERAPSERGRGAPTARCASRAARRAHALRSLGARIEDDAAAQRSRARAATRSSPRRCARIVIAALADVDEQRERAARWSSSATTARRATWRRDLRAWLAPRRVRYYPSRGVAYESHLAPPPHLVGLRVAALDALLGRRAATAARRATAGRSSSSARWRCRRRCPTRRCARTRSRCAWASCSTSTSARRELVAAGYERVDQVEERGQFALRGGLLDVFPATEERAVRVDMFDVEIESLRWFSTFTQRSLGDVAGGRDRARRRARRRAPRAGRDRRRRPAPSAPAGERRAARAPGHRRAAAGRALRRAARPDRRATPSCSSPPRRSWRRRSSDHWSDVCAAFGDEDAHHLYVSPEEHRRRRSRQRARIWLSAISARPGDRAARAVGRHGGALAGRGRAGAREARALGLPHGRRVPAPRRGRARGLQPRAPESELARRGRRRRARTPLEPSLRFAAASLREGFVAPSAEARGVPRAPAAAPPPRRARRRRRGAGGRGAARRGALRSFTELRTGDIVVHEDHGVARFAGFETRTVADVTRDYLYLEYQGDDRVFVPTDQLAKISRYVGAGGEQPAAVASSAARAGRR